MVKCYLTILLLCTICWASKFGAVMIMDSSGNTVGVTPDSAMIVTMQDTLTVELPSDDTMMVEVTGQPLTVVIDSTDSNVTFVNIGAGGIGYSRDNSTNAFNTIEYEHHEIHSGSHYFVCDYSTVSSGDSLGWQLTTSNTTKWIHMTFQVEGTQELTVEVYEDATVAADGSTATAYNNNRNSGNTTSLTLLQCCGTVSDAGTRIYGQQTGVAGNANKARQGFSERSREVILKQNSTYRFVITSGGSGNNISYCGEWYEHTDKN